MKIAIWGTGSMALKFYYSHKNRYDVVCFFDNDSSKYGNYIDGRPISRLEKEPLENIYIIIASTWWKDIAVQLSEAGKKPFVDYMPSCFADSLLRYTDIYALGKAVGFDKIDYAFMTDKKIAVVYGNCQTDWLERAFTLYKDFNQEYLIIETPSVGNYIYYKEVADYLSSDVCFWANVDLFIYQTVKRDNKFSERLATENILKLLSSDTLKVNILNLYFKGYFPQMTNKKAEILNELNWVGLFACGDRYIDDMLSQGMTATEIKAEVLRDDFISREDIEAAVKDSINELIEREKYVDVKITDYIMENYCSEQLFYSHHHPNEKVLLEYTERIMRLIGYDTEEISPADAYLLSGTLKGQDIPVYPSVIKVLGLQKYEKKFYPNRWLCNILVDIEEYIDLYIENYKDRVR